MKVILTEYVYKHGVAGEVVSVADGFARNFLLPRHLAMKASAANLEKLGDLRSKATQNRTELNDKLSAAARQIDGVELVFGAKAGNNNKLYGSITTQMIAESLREKTGVDINRRRISERTLRELGRYRVPVRMGTDQSPVVNVVILREEEVAPYLAGQMAPPPLIEHAQNETAEPVGEAVELADASNPAAE
ncbi:MAG: 50S ribosomal protein L9 [Aggregatilineales bacterium]